VSSDSQASIVGLWAQTPGDTTPSEINRVTATVNAKTGTQDWGELLG